MASALLTLAAILYFTTSLFLTISIQVQSLSPDLDTFEDEEEYVLELDTPFTQNPRLGSRRFLATVFKIKKGAKCDATGKKKNICDGVYANNGTSLLNCCKKHCRNVYGDRNNCGACGQKCGFGQRCCNGKCTDVLRNDNNCGKCGRKCSKGVGCQYGVCGYA